MRKATFFYLLRRGLLGAGGFVRDGLVMAASKFKLSGITHPAQGSAEFDGASYIDIEKDTDITNATFVAWYYSTTTSSHRTIASSEGFRFQIRGNFEVRFDIKSSGGQTSIAASGTTYHDQWQFVSVTKSGNAYTLYQNGSQIGTATGTVTPNDIENISIGKDEYSGIGGADWMNGNLANVAIWNRALSSDEINAVMWKGYQSLTDNEKSGLQAWYSLDDVASPAASLATMEQLATDKEATIENKAASTAAINALS